MPTLNLHIHWVKFLSPPKTKLIRRTLLGQFMKFTAKAKPPEATKAKPPEANARNSTLVKQNAL